MPFERAVEEIGAEGLGLAVQLRPGLLDERADAGRRRPPASARFDGRSLAIAEPPTLAVPEAGGPAMPGQTGPYAMTGLSWLPLPDPRRRRPPTASTSRSPAPTAVRLDLARMAVDVARPVTGTVTTDAAVALRLAGPWTRRPVVTVGGLPVPVTLADGVLTVTVPAGTSSIQVLP